MFKKVVSVSMMLVSQVANAFTYTLEITEQELQDKVAAMMPLEKQKRFYTVVISDPKIDLIKKTNEVGVSAKLDAVILGSLKGNGRARIEGSIEYRPEQGAFYLRDAEIVSLDIEKVPKDYNAVIKRVTQKALVKLLARNPVYKFKDDDLKHKLAKSVLKSVQVKGKHLAITLSTF